MEGLHKAAKLLFCLLLALCLTGSQTVEKREIRPTNFRSFPDHIIADFAKKVRDEYGFICTATGGSMPNDIESIYVNFTSKKMATFDEAREYEVLLIEGLMKLINADETIRPYLRNYPFPTKRVNISISFEAPTKKEEEQQYVSHIFQARNLLFYRNCAPVEKYRDADFTEPYSEAYQIVKKKRSSENRSL